MAGASKRLIAYQGWRYIGSRCGTGARALARSRLRGCIAGPPSRSGSSCPRKSDAGHTFYCYDARNQLKNAAAAAGCASPTETYTYDDAGNRLSALAAGATRTFAYTIDGQLSSCANPSCTVAHDSAGRLTQLTDGGTTWTYEYDSEGRLVKACNASSCAATPARVEFTYDGEGHRTRIVATTAGGTATTTDIRYQGDRVAAEVTGAITRDFTTDEAGVIRKMVVTGGADAGTYHPVWNGHGDLTALWRVNADGSLTLAASVTYTTWGRPSVTTHNGIGDLSFRYLYVGASDVQWDAELGLGLLYMHARHYSPVLGRFLQPDPIDAEANLYGYAENSPVTNVDPSGTVCEIAIFLGPQALLVHVQRSGWSRPQLGAPLRLAHTFIRIR